MRRRIVWEIISLEFRLFFRSGYRQNQAATIVTLIFFNASFGIWMSGIPVYHSFFNSVVCFNLADYCRRRLAE